METQIKELGCANGWGVFSPRPTEMDAHNEAKKTNPEAHREEWRQVGRCLTRGTCPTCGITWTVDSSD